MSAALLSKAALLALLSHLSSPVSANPEAEQPLAEELLGPDDECLVDSTSEACASYALQRRALTVAASEDRQAVEANASWASCSKYGCGAHYASWRRCQCNSDCEHYNSCCSDYQSKCKAPKKESSREHGSCASYGCGGSYVHGRSCQCTSSCSRYNNCCGDYWNQCKAPEKHKQSSGSCASYGCGGSYVHGRSCQCTSKCQRYGNCCSDFASQCQKRGPEPPAPGPTPAAPASGPAPSPGASYSLDWAAQGHNFFDGFSFITEDMNHGAAHYLEKGMAISEGVAQAHGSHAILGAGRRDPQYQYKRHSAKIATSKSWKYFLATMRFSHVPYGCGVWPAFFTLAPGRQWPDGGEVDVLEYVNDDSSKTSFHSSEDCRLNQAAMNKFGGMPDRNKMDYQCKTQYPDHLGCAPNKWMRTGQGWAHTPGVLALERTPDHLKIFFLPEGRIPGDLSAGRPKPDSWDHSMLLSYYPFTASGCSQSVMGAQQLVLGIGFCGDWASKVWGDSAQCKGRTRNCRSVDPLAEYAPEQDCCTQFVYDADGHYDTDSYMKHQAYFNISYIKVFTPSR